MKRSRFNEEEVIGILREFGQGGVRDAQYQRGDVLRMEAQIWGYGRERSAAAAWA
jgi:hypothetical protein